MRDAGGPVLVRGRGDVDERHEDGEQSRQRQRRRRRRQRRRRQQRRRQSREHDVSGRCPTWARYTHVDAARGAARAATSSDESRDERRRQRESAAGASAEEARPQKKVRDDTHPGGVRVAAFPINYAARRARVTESRGRRERERARDLSDADLALPPRLATRASSRRSSPAAQSLLSRDVIAASFGDVSRTIFLATSLAGYFRRLKSTPTSETEGEEIAVPANLFTRDQLLLSVNDSGERNEAKRDDGPRRRRRLLLGAATRYKRSWLYICMQLWLKISRSANNVGVTGS